MQKVIHLITFFNSFVSISVIYTMNLIMRMKARTLLFTLLICLIGFSGFGHTTSDPGQNSEAAFVNPSGDDMVVIVEALDAPVLKIFVDNRLPDDQVSIDVVTPIGDIDTFYFVGPDNCEPTDEAIFLNSVENNIYRQSISFTNENPIYFRRARDGLSCIN